MGRLREDDTKQIYLRQKFFRECPPSHLEAPKGSEDTMDGYNVIVVAGTAVSSDLFREW